MKWDDGVCELDKAELKMMLTFASSDLCRLNLTQVHFDPGRAEVVACDGHTLLLCKTIGKSDKLAFGVDCDALDSVRAAMKAKDRLLIGWHADGDRLVLSCTALPSPVEIKPYGHEPPPYREIIPEWTEQLRELPPLGFDTEYLARLPMVQKTIGAPGMRCLLDEDELGPSMFKCAADGVDATVVIMPMRV